MAKQRRNLDIWIVEGNTVYREVPFTVVTDWLQQGRLLGEDQARPAGGTGWHRLDAIPALAAFLPRPEPLAVGDVAEAAEPVEMDFHYKRPEEEDDPDLIPLIDVTLVLLIFFMMTAVPQLMSNIDTPPALYQRAKIDEGAYWVGIERASKDEPRYSLGQGNQILQSPTATAKTIRDRLRTELGRMEGEVGVRIRADKTLPIEVVKDMMMDLQDLQKEINVQHAKTGKRALKIVLHGEVSEP